MFRLIKQIFISAMMVFSSLPNVNPLECISMKNQECKVRPEIVNVILIILYFTLLVSRQINVVAIVIILLIHMQEFVSLIL